MEGAVPATDRHGRATKRGATTKAAAAATQAYLAAAGAAEQASFSFSQREAFQRSIFHMFSS